MGIDKEPGAPDNLESIDPIEKTAGIIRYREQLENCIEAPLLPACRDLYDKNILTFSSSANRKDLEQGSVYILLDYESLSAENKKIAEAIGTQTKSRNHTAIELNMAVTPDTTVQEIEKGFLDMSLKFKKQKLTWAKAFTREDLIKLWPMCDGSEYENPAAWKDMGYYYNEKDGFFYESEEFIDKINENR